MFIATVLLIGVVYLSKYADWSLSHPFIYLSIILLIYVIGPLYDFVALDSREATWALLNEPRAILVQAGFVVLVGMAAFVYGFSSARGSALATQIPSFPETWDGQRAREIITLYAIIGTAFFLPIAIFSVGGDISSKRTFYSSYFRWFVRFLLFAGFLGLLTTLEEGRKLSSLLGLLSLCIVFVYFVFGFLISSRSAIMWTTILLFGFYIQYRRIRAVLLFSVGTVFAVLSAIMLSLRANSGLRLTPVTIFESLAGADRGNVTVIAHLVHQLPTEMEFLYGRGLFQWLVFPIPRAIWPGKPFPASRELAIEIYNAGNRTPPMLFGDLYWNLGIIGVLIGLLAIGFVFRLLVEYRATNSNSPSVILLTTVVLFLAGRFPSAEKMFISLCLYLVPLGMAALYIARVEREVDFDPDNSGSKFSNSHIYNVLYSNVVATNQYAMLAIENSTLRRILLRTARRIRGIAQRSYFIRFIEEFDQNP
ncbi:hypothetical protein M0R89_04085 [Halorussus limi]|uniref:Oligosaccharide repeat unit polymerase n=1 Tax=Halorussus limi TaxID=2938695 RepID=A0A8U0HVY9_9EURY|nr:hypothetical protein [Halorussus limi]UPV75252.1 hypothetical protein M0R89_04085 [Halorussus limi]